MRVYAGNRDQVTRRYAALFDRHRNPLSDEFQQEKKTLEGLERYLVQLWRESLAARANGPVAVGATWLLAPRVLLVLALAPAEGVADLPDERAAAVAPALALAEAGGVVRELRLAPAAALVTAP